VRGGQTDARGRETSVSGGAPKLGGAEHRRTNSQSSTYGEEAARDRPVADMVRDALDDRAWPIVIDDFQYVPLKTRRDIARAVKTLIARTHVVLIAVPHEAFEPVRAEPDMNGRVWQLEVEPWDMDELMFIAREGFTALNIVDRDGRVGKILAEASYGAPFLMQQLCHDYARSLGVTQTATEPVVAEAPDWHDFFRRVADRSEPGVFAKLLEGPTARGQARTQRRFKAVDATLDIYGAVLYGIAKAGPEHPIKYQEIVHILDESFYEKPRPNQVTHALGHMHEIAEKERGASDPALVYRNGIVHVMDPFFAFYLEYGSWIR
jgi:hypothetical protein